jgi:MSHA biogenesis protein MshK
MKSSLIPHSSSLALCLALAAGTAAAQLTNDPTRPPVGYAAESPEIPAAEPGGPRLQSVLISPSHKAAIISGVMVKEGDKFGDAVLVKVAESEVVLKSAGASQVLKLYPGVEKREIVPGEKGDTRRSKAGGAPAR